MVTRSPTTSATSRVSDSIVLRTYSRGRRLDREGFRLEPPVKKCTNRSGGRWRVPSLIDLRDQPRQRAFRFSLRAVDCALHVPLLGRALIASDIHS